MRHFHALRFAEHVEDGVERVQVLAATMLVHGEEGSDGAVGFSVRGVALGEDGERSGSWAAAEGSHAAY